MKPIKVYVWYLCEKLGIVLKFHGSRQRNLRVYYTVFTWFVHAYSWFATVMKNHVS